MSALSDLLQEANRELQLSAQRIEDAARAKGFDVSHSTAWAYMTGRHGVKVSDDVLRALAAVLPVRLTDLRKAAKMAPDLGEYVPPPEARSLTNSERDALTTIIKAMARSRAAAVTDLSTRRRPGMSTVDPEDYDEVAALRSPEEAGQPEE